MPSKYKPLVNLELETDGSPVEDGSSNNPSSPLKTSHTLQLHPSSPNQLLLSTDERMSSYSESKSKRDSFEDFERLQFDSKKDDDQDVEQFTKSIVPETDDSSMPQFTFRVLVLGTFWCVLFSVANTALSFRTNPFNIDTSVAILLSYPLGRFMARWIPKGVMNPGDFNVKEHVLISIIAGAGGAGAYGIDNVIVQRSAMFMGNTAITFGESLLWVMATQFIGYFILSNNHLDLESRD
jgi:hypothetical protein